MKTKESRSALMIVGEYYGCGGDTLSISDITYGGDDGDLVDNGDGTFTFMPNENFNGEIDIDYKVFDGTDEVATH
ncbi:cadherin-like domain-containing protein [Vibrio chagasii]|nr:cadherin-like domain-containing protein [Vibrio chagasii]